MEPKLSRLDRSLITGIAWTGAARWTVQIVSWASTIIVARLLLPKDYGLVGIALVFLGLVHLINEFGLGPAIIQQRDLTGAQLRQLSLFSILFGIFLFAMSVALAGPVSWVFREPQVQLVIIVASPAFLLGGVRLVPRALLTKEQRFRTLAVIDVFESGAQIVVTLVLAYRGFGLWSLVLGTLSGRVVGLGSTLWYKPPSVGFDLDFRKIRNTLTFGRHMITANIALFVYRSADSAIIGRILGATQLGYYSIGVSLGTAPSDKINELLSRVMPAVFSETQDRTEILRRYVLNVSGVISLLTFPLAVGLFLVAKTLVVTLLGARWAPAALPVGILALASAFRSLVPLLMHVLIATGRPELNARTTIALAVIMPPLFLIGSMWGLTAVALVWLVAPPVVLGTTVLRWAFNTVRISLREYLSYLAPAAGSTLVMALVILGVRLATDGMLAGVPRLVADVTVGIISYGVSLVVFFRPQLTKYQTILLQLRA